MPHPEIPGWNCVKEIGGGGQAKVWLAESNKDKTRKCAIKIIHKPDDEKAIKRFYAEIEAIKRVEHPDIIPIVNSSNEKDPIHYYVMEYVEDLKSLNELRIENKNPFFQNPIAAIDGYIHLLNILLACHREKVIHRDISPNNVMVTKENKIKLIDFGLCFIGDWHRMTSTGEGVGTFGFRAPECLGYDLLDEAIPQSDLYSAGKLLWMMITNKWPFDREDRFFNQLSLSIILPDLPMSWHLQRIFEKTIRHDPRDRYENTQIAIEDAKNVRGTILGNYLPIESLTSPRCHVCGVGEVNHFPQGESESISNILTRAGLQWRVESVYVCPYCYNVTLFCNSLLIKKIEDRKKFK